MESYSARDDNGSSTAPTSATAPSVPVIIGFTPFHLLIMRGLADRLASPAWVFHPDLLTASDPYWQKAGHTLLGRRALRFGGRYAGYMRAASDLRRLLQSHAIVDAYLPHPYHPLANGLFFSPACARCFIYEDGLLNYYDAEIGTAHPRHLLRQSLRSMALGFRYRPYTGHITGVDAKVIDGGFFTRPNHVARADKFPELHQVTLTTATTAGPAREKLTLFLDQPIEWEMPLQRAHALRQRAIDLCHELGHPVLYKPHHAQQEHSNLQSHWLQLPEDQQILPAETVLGMHSVSHVVGYFSSALINIALAAPSIHCFALGCESMPITIDGRASTLAEVFRNAGVTTID